MIESIKRILNSFNSVSQISETQVTSTQEMKITIGDITKSADDSADLFADNANLA